MKGISDLPGLWLMSELGDQLTRSDERIDPARKPNEKYLYVGLENIESDTGRLMEAPEVFGSEIKSTKNIFKPGDILYGKLRPYLNKVHLAETNGICSTDLWVLRPTSTIDSMYAAHYLRSAHVLQRVSQLATGANLPRVSGAAFDVIPVPLPPLPEQGHIAAILRQADELHRVRREANEKAKGLVPALFREMFGDPITNPKGWDIEPLDKFVSFTTSGSRGWAKYYSPQGAKFIRVQNLTGHRLNFEDMAFVSPPDTVEARRTKVEPRDLLFTITGVVGLVAVVSDNTGDAYVSQHVAIVRLVDDIDPTFAWAFLSDTDGGQSQINRLQYGQTKPGLGLDNIRAIKIFHPTLALQKEFSQRVTEVFSTEVLQAASRSQLDDLFQSILAQAFTGELTASWREQHREELTKAAEEMRQRLEEKKRPVELVRVEITTDEALKESLSNFNLVAEALAKSTQEAFAKTITPPISQEFYRLGEILKPYTQSLAESLNAAMAQHIAEIRSPVADILANAMTPLMESLRQQSQFYYSDLLAKIARLAQLQQRESPTRAELQEAIRQVIERLPQYWTLIDLAEDWRVNHLPRNTVREIVDMLVVMGQLRETMIRHETEDRQQPPQFIRAYTRVLDSERVTAAEIQL